MILRSLLIPGMLFFASVLAYGQAFEGVIADSETGKPISGVSVELLEDKLTATTSKDGRFRISVSSRDAKTLRFKINGYMFDEKRQVAPASGLTISLRKAKKSAATIREEGYIANGCEIDNPEKEDWNIRFEHSLLKGDLAPDPEHTRRDPSAVIRVDGTYYVWYSYSKTHHATKTAPWDLNDLYFATSADGETWKEQGPAVTRGPAGAFDHRSVFTTEIFVHDGLYYLIYQAAADQDGVFNRNFVGMAQSNSPDGPWTKVEQPVLRPTGDDRRGSQTHTVESQRELEGPRRGLVTMHQIDQQCRAAGGTPPEAQRREISNRVPASTRWSPPGERYHRLGEPK